MASQVSLAHQVPVTSIKTQEMKQEFFSGMRLWTDVLMKYLKQVILVKSRLEFRKTSSFYELFGYLSPYVF